MGIDSAQEYFEQRDSGELGCTQGDFRDIEMLLALGGDSARQDLLDFEKELTSKQQ